MTAPQPRVSPEGLEGYTLEQLDSLWRILDPGQRAYVKMYYERARKFNKMATDALNKRQARLSYLLDYSKANGLTEYNTREKIIHDWVFTDANDDWLRWGREARRCQVAMDVELKMASLLAMEVPVAG